MSHIPSVIYMFPFLHSSFSICCPCACPMSFVVTYEHHNPWCHRQQDNMQENREYFFLISLCGSKRTFQRHSPVRLPLTLSLIIGKCYTASAAKSHQSCPTLCDPIDGSPPGSSIPGILQARTVEWVAISFSNAWKWKVKVRSLSRVWLLVTPWTAAHQAPPSMGFSRQEDWSG